MSGYVYALRPVDLPILKIGSTANPRERAKQLAAFSPCPMQFTRIIRVKNKRHAAIWEQFVHSRTHDFTSHGEWRHENEAVYAALDKVPGDPCEVGDVFEQRETRRKFLPLDEIELRLLVADAEEYFRYGFDMHRELGLSHNWHQGSANSANVRRKIKGRVKAFLDAQDGPPRGDIVSLNPKRRSAA